LFVHTRIIVDTIVEITDVMIVDVIVEIIEIVETAINGP
jgi:hypothetical protein